MKAIGGYFELELKQAKSYHRNAISLNLARNCLEYILRVRKYKKIYIPYFTCEVLLEPLRRVGIDVEFYSINKFFDPIREYRLEENEAFLYTNYWGLKSSTIMNLKNIYGRRLIVDNSQAFYAQPVEGIDTFYSARKFFGVPDGAYLYIDETLKMDIGCDISINRMSHLLKRIDLGVEQGYEDFKNNEEFIDQPILKMSLLTETLMKSIDYKYIANVRKRNFEYLSSKLGSKNEYSFTIGTNEIPMVYPFLSKEGESLKEMLISKHIFVATYWPNVLEWCNPKSMEFFLTKNVLALPIDQRLEISDLDRIINILNL